MPRKTAPPKSGGKRTARTSFETQLRQAVTAVDVADTLTSPLKNSIANLLRLAARAVGSEEASVLVRDGNKGGLKFLVAIGAVADKLLKLKIPPGKGIAGFVFSSGQPLAVADVGKEETFYDEVDKKVGFTTETILATPLRVNDHIVGVLEFVNRTGFPPYEPFTPEDMDRAAHFADAIATLVEAHETANLIENLFERLVTPAKENFDKDLRAWIKKARSAPEHKELLALAVSLHALASRGDAERRLCHDMLDALARFMDSGRAGADYLNF
jgi:transcriptional regulator with GAF, ATPase, and Fis domain